MSEPRHALVAYWSLGGHTTRVAEAVAEGVRAAGATCDLIDLRAGAVAEITPYDIVGIGFPVHYFRPPPPVTAAIASLGPLHGRAAFAFCLHGTYRGAGIRRARHALSRSGARVLGTFACHGGGGFYPYALRGWEFSPTHPDEQDLEAARTFGAEMVRAASLHDLPDAAAPIEPLTHPMYALERLAAHPLLASSLYYRLFRVDRERCTKCGLCARKCPVGAIAWQRGEFPRWDSRCILCLNCEFICPESAIRSPMDWVLFRPFIAWNVKRALRDPALDRAAVRIQRGKTVLLSEGETRSDTDE